jgi:MFS family permease
VPAERRGLALGIWGGIGGLAIAIGPLVGGAVVSGISWHWIFWLNVPIGIVLAPLAYARLDETKAARVASTSWASRREYGHVRHRLGPRARELARLDERRHRRADRPRVLLVAAFAAWELRAPSPMLPMEFFRNRTFTLTNVASLFMFFGMFGSIFFLARTSRPCRATRRCSRACGSCRGRRCRC